MSRLSIIPAVDSVCLTVPANTQCVIEFGGNEACDEILKLQGDFGAIKEDGVLPIIFRHGDVIIRCLETRKEVIDHIGLFEKECEAAQLQAQQDLSEKVSSLKDSTLKNMLETISPHKPIFLEEVRSAEKKL
jgi:hypothetical protein